MNTFSIVADVHSSVILGKPICDTWIIKRYAHSVWANMDGGVVAVRARACSHPGDFSLK